MNISEAWLREWVNPPVGNAALCDAMTMAGLKVDGSEALGLSLAGVVVGRVDAVAKHPDADRLNVCQVFDGKETLQIVCGAANVRAGMLVPLATVGATLPNGTVISAAKLRGVASSGMLCSAVELTLGDDGSGLLELEPGLTPGTPLADTIAAADHVIEIDLTPNRGDCLSIRGIAREIAAIYRAPMTEPSTAPVRAQIDDAFPIAVHAPEACPRYLGRVIRGVDRGSVTPLWMQERLRRSGMRSIDAVVDVTNYVMLELGQPLHAFDLARLRGGIEVRFAREGEQIELLDGKLLGVRTNTLVIADAEGPVALAGIMGGARSGIQDGVSRCDVFLECALFTPKVIRGVPRSYGLHTESSQRYERGVDFNLQALAMERATALLLEICGGQPGPVTGTNSEQHLPPRSAIALRATRVNALLGTEIPEHEIEDCLLRLSFNVSRDDALDGAGRWSVVAPSHRYDAEAEIDLIEEVVRLHGYNNIPDALPVTDLQLITESEQRRPLTSIRERLIGLGYQEAITYSFIDPRHQDLLQPGSTPIRVDNPLSAEMSVMRTSLWPGLVRAAQYNANRQRTRLKLFETGRCFPSLAKMPESVDEIEQNWRLGGVLLGNREPESWSSSNAPFDFFDVKGDVEMLLADAHVRGDGDTQFVPLDHPALHQGQAAEVRRGGRAIGRLGRLHPSLAEELGLSLPVYLFELELDPLRVQPARRYSPFANVPSVRRDLALLVDRSVPAEALLKSVRGAVGATLTELKLFDLYEGEGIDSQKKSVGLGLTLQEPSRTLTDEEASAITERVVQVLKREFDAERR